MSFSYLDSFTLIFAVFNFTLVMMHLMEHVCLIGREMLALFRYFSYLGFNDELLRRHAFRGLVAVGGEASSL